MEAYLKIFFDDSNGDNLDSVKTIELSEKQVMEIESNPHWNTIKKIIENKIQNNISHVSVHIPYGYYETETIYMLSMQQQLINKILIEKNKRSN